MSNVVDIIDYAGKYQITDDGRVLSNHYGGRQLKPDNRKGYLSVVLSKEGKLKRVGIHRLVAEHFIPNPNSKPQVNHIDLDKLNNHVSNLEWVTVSENTKHAQINGALDTAYTNAKVTLAANRLTNNTLSMERKLKERFKGLIYKGYRTYVKFNCYHCNTETEARTDSDRLKYNGRCNHNECKKKEKELYGN